MDLPTAFHARCWPIDRFSQTPSHLELRSCHHDDVSLTSDFPCLVTQVRDSYTKGILFASEIVVSSFLSFIAIFVYNLKMGLASSQR